MVKKGDLIVDYMVSAKYNHKVVARVATSPDNKGGFLVKESSPLYRVHYPYRLFIKDEGKKWDKA